MVDSDERGPALTIRLFGPFEARLGGATVDGIRLRKADRLLAYLALYHRQWVAKDSVAAALWAGEEVYDPRQNLRQTLLYLRGLLPPESTWVESRSGELRLNLGDHALDVEQFEIACNTGTYRSLEEALTLAEAPLLESWRDEWITVFRKKYGERVERVQMRWRALEHADSGPRGLASGGRDTKAPGGTERAPDRTPAPVGGAVPLDSPFYIERAADHALFAAIAQRESITLIKGARQTGKSSLLARGMQFARQAGMNVCEADCDLMAPEDMTTLETFYIRLAGTMAESSGREFSPERDWKRHLSANGNLERFLRRHILEVAHTPVLWTLDGVDKLFKTSFYAAFFALLRGLHTKRATEPHGPWERLSIAITSATEAHLYIPDLDQSPFNVGTRIAMADFTDAETDALYRRYPGALPSHEEKARMRQLLGGHPYLITRGLAEIHGGRLTVEEFPRFALRPDGPYHDHLEGIRRLISADERLREATLSVLQGKVCAEPEFFRLRSAGVFLGDSAETGRPRCGLYGEYLARSLK